MTDCYRGQDWVGLRRLYHDEALLCTQAADGRVVGPDEVVGIFEDLQRTVYSVGEAANVIVDDDAVMVSARLRYQPASGGMADVKRVWLLTFKDGLVYRSRYYRSETEALAAYAAHGIGLGLDAPTD